MCYTIVTKGKEKEITKMKLFKRKENKKVYKIAFCDACDISTKFSEYYVDYPTYEAAKNAIFSKNAGDTFKSSFVGIPFGSLSVT